MIIGNAISVCDLRKKNGGGGTDADAQAFITATGISGTNATATNKLVLDLKSANIWTKMKAVYPLVGGSATSHKFNLKDSRDLDAAFRLVFAGGLTHSSNGILGNNTNGWIDTFLNMSSQYSSAYDVHFSMNIYNDASGTFPQNHITSSGGAASNTYRLFSSSTTNESSYMGINSQAVNKTVTSTSHKGFWCGSRTANNVHNFIDPTGTINSNTSTVSITLPSIAIGLLTNKTNAGISQYSGFGYSFFSIGNGLTTTELAAFKTAVNNFQTTLGRI